MRNFTSHLVLLVSACVVCAQHCIPAAWHADAAGRFNPSMSSEEELRNLNVSGDALTAKVFGDLGGFGPLENGRYIANIFEGPIATDMPPKLFKRTKHPVSRHRVLDSPDLAVGTNLFYANNMLNDTMGGSHTLPHLLTYVRDPTTNPHEFIGMLVSQPERTDIGFGGWTGDRVRYYVNPVALFDIAFSSTEFVPALLTRTVDRTSQFSANINIHSDRVRYGDKTKKITFPLVQGMGFTTAQYLDLIPEIGFDRGIHPQGMKEKKPPRSGMQKFKIRVEAPMGLITYWLLWVIPDDPEDKANFPEWTTTPNKRRIYAKKPFKGVFQIAKLPRDTTKAIESVFDSAAGSYHTTATLTGSVNGNKGSYALSYSRHGRSRSGKLLTFLLPHHVESLDPGLRSGLTVLKHKSFTKGMMVAFLGNSVKMHETMPVDYSFLPYEGKIDKAAIPYILKASNDDLADMLFNTNLDTAYFSGKSLSRKANALLAVMATNADPTRARRALIGLKNAMKVWTSNQQQMPWMYDTTWKGIISSIAFVRNDSGADYGGAYYNDHHFHYGYHIYTAAVISYCDQVLNKQSSWMQQNKRWVNHLVRDVASPSTKDPWYPAFRAFDWYHGHSWAKGLFACYDGKDQESTSEDYNFAFAMKLWGMVTGDLAMEARGNLMLGIMRRTVNAYFLMDKDNKNHPPAFVKNMVTGILFENKVDYATYFGNNTEYIHGIQMLPQTSISEYIRPRKFVKAEWERHFDNGRAEQAKDGWKSILMANYALLNPKRAFDYFAQDGFQPDWMDNGLSRTWCLAYSAMMEYGQRSSKGAK